MTDTSFNLNVQQDDSTVISFTDTTVEFIPSEAVSWAVSADNKITANLKFPKSCVHDHHYSLVPIKDNDSANYKVTSVSTPYMDGSLRVSINGIRLNPISPVYVPPSHGPQGTWSLTTYVENASNGSFILNRAITSSDVIMIDFDTIYIQ